MLNKLIFLVLSMIFLSCYSVRNNHTFIEINADSLVKYSDQYLNKRVEITGNIVHICGVDGKKMKLKTTGASIIKIIPDKSKEKFDTSFYKKIVKIQGIVSELKIDKGFVEKMDKQKTLLCHIDHTPCKDTAWILKQKLSGNADSISSRDIKRLKDKMNQSKKDCQLPIFRTIQI